MSTPAKGSSPELWAWAAFGLAASYAVFLLVMGSRPGGALAIWLWTFVPPSLGIAGLALGVVGLVWSVLRRPLQQRRRVLALACSACVVVASAYPMPYPSSHERRPSRLEFALPVEGEWTVRWGGERWRENPLVSLPDRRWGVHLVLLHGGSAFVGTGERAQDYHAFGAAVFAPCAGRVQVARDGDPDRSPLDRRKSRGLAAEPGNLVVLEVASGQYLFLTGLQAGSLAVQEGQAVGAGELLGRVGSSGSSRYTPLAHLAMHLQDTPEPYRGESIPWSLNHYMADGVLVERGQPRGGVTREGVHRGQQVRRAD